MKKTNDLLDAVKSRYGLPSDYALAAKLGMTRSMVSGYRHGKSRLGDDAALRVAELLELDAGFVFACMEAERAQTEAARKVWKRPGAGRQLGNKKPGTRPGETRHKEKEESAGLLLLGFDDAAALGIAEAFFQASVGLGSGALGYFSTHCALLFSA